MSDDRVPASAILKNRLRDQLIVQAQALLELDHLTAEDADILRKALSDLRFYIASISSIVDVVEDNAPPETGIQFMESIWGALMCSLIAGQHMTTTESANRFFKGESTKAARDAKASTRAKKEYDKIVARVATEYVQKHGLWKLSERAFAKHLLPGINRAAAAALLKPLEEGAVRGRIKPYLAPK